MITAGRADRKTPRRSGRDCSTLAENSVVDPIGTCFNGASRGRADSGSAPSHPTPSRPREPCDAEALRAAGHDRLLPRASSWPPTPKTITGEGKCAKCALKETDDLPERHRGRGGRQDRQVLPRPRTSASKKYHETVCKATVKTTATGEVKEKDGKKIMTATKVEKAK